MKDLIACGKFLKPHGVHGEMKFAPYLPDNLSPDALREGRAVPPEGARAEAQEVVIDAVRETADGWIIRLQGCDTPEDARRFNQWELHAARDLLAPLEEGEYLYQDVIGCEVVDEKGAVIGTVRGVIQTGANDVWEVDLPGKGGEVLIPVIKDVVLSIDLERNRAVVRMMDGLVE